MPHLMYDAADPAVILNQVPATAYAVAGYVGPFNPADNRFVTYDAVLRRFHGKAHTLGIAVHQEYDAECLDVETGDATPDQAPAWMRRQISRGVWRPVIYCQASTMPTLQGVLNSAGFQRDQYRLWVAAYPGSGPNVTPGFDAHQYADVGPGGVNEDLSMVADDFFEPPTPPPDPHHYDWFDGGTIKDGPTLLHERSIAQQYDAYRAQQTPTNHPHRPQLAVLRTQCRWLAHRLDRVAIHLDPLSNGQPSWDKYHRGWRHLELSRRANGDLVTN